MKPKRKTDLCACGCWWISDGKRCPECGEEPWGEIVDIVDGVMKVVSNTEYTTGGEAIDLSDELKAR